MPTKIKIKNSNSAGKIPKPADLDVAELAINLADKKVFTKEPGGTVVEVSPQPDYADKQEILDGTVADKVISPKDLNDASLYGQALASGSNDTAGGFTGNVGINGSAIPDPDSGEIPGSLLVFSRPTTGGQLKLKFTESVTNQGGEISVTVNPGESCSDLANKVDVKLKKIAFTAGSDATCSVSDIFVSNVQPPTFLNINDGDDEVALATAFADAMQIYATATGDKSIISRVGNVVTINDVDDNEQFAGYEKGQVINSDVTINGAKNGTIMTLTFTPGTANKDTVIYSEGLFSTIQGPDACCLMFYFQSPEKLNVEVLGPAPVLYKRVVRVGPNEVITPNLVSKTIDDSVLKDPTERRFLSSQDVIGNFKFVNTIPTENRFRMELFYDPINGHNKRDALTVNTPVKDMGVLLHKMETFDAVKVNILNPEETMTPGYEFLPLISNSLVEFNYMGTNHGDGTQFYDIFIDPASHPATTTGHTEYATIIQNSNIKISDSFRNGVLNLDEITNSLFVSEADTLFMIAGKCNNTSLKFKAGTFYINEVSNCTIDCTEPLVIRRFLFLNALSAFSEKDLTFSTEIPGTGELRNITNSNFCVKGHLTFDLEKNSIDFTNTIIHADTITIDFKNQQRSMNLFNSSIKANTINLVNAVPGFVYSNVPLNTRNAYGVFGEYSNLRS